ncbi:Crp/Fnr family transcriptional regulator [Desulfopila sp. IMCC35008]|uniref:Crp/Fnr family transcriptional regulator n=1 Tax=Desulfopila sp. IMCC35008 TaxID=2653858 RepID=UPI0013D619DE|nr:cyclic nucleotide-binding domain-containing protein [Desulfopila sp. IMCC35008]
MSLLPENDRQEQVAEYQHSLELLETLPLFKGLPGRVLKLLSFLCEKGVYAAGDTLLGQGDDPGLAVYVMTGEVKALPPQDSDADTVTGFTAGAFLCGLSLLGSMPSFYTLEAVDKTEVLLLRRDQFQSIIEKFPEVAPLLIQTILRLIREWDSDQLYTKEGHPGREYGITLL